MRPEARNAIHLGADPDVAQGTHIERAGTGAGEAADPDVSEATAGVTRSVDRPEAPAQARPLATIEKEL